MNQVTFVSALFNIDRVDGRKWDQYLKWFEKTLKLQVPMVLFIEDSLKDFVNEKRGDLPTKIICQTVEEIPYYHLKEPIQEILDSDDYKNNISDPDRIECKQAMYSIIQYSKFPWLNHASKLNSFDSDVYFWLDAGASRFFNNFDLTELNPGNS